jgi:2-keto-4-pentenoate hydratase/2-oxohepta-3-ene-1,7-dioic acid hydratase in catechol pathway
MRIANYGGRAHIVVDKGVIDVGEASSGRWDGSPAALFDDWRAFRSWARTADLDEDSPTLLDPQLLRAPSPTPRQVFAVGLNYAAHAAEGGMEPPEAPPIFTKYLSSLTGPFGEIALPSATVDWEVELVVVIGVESTRVAEDEAWGQVAGLTIGQDLSDRVVQLRPPAPQFSLGKSFPGFGPTGPWLVTPDELDDPDDLGLGCSIDGVSMQDSRTSDLIFSVPRLVAHLSSVVTLHPGDLIFTGTPCGVGAGRQPPRFLEAGDELTSHIEGIGEMRHRFVAPSTGRPTGDRR